MTRINAIRYIVPTRDSVAWGKDFSTIAASTWGTIHPLTFGAVLIACSLTIGCSSDQPKPANSNTQLPVAQTPPPAPVLLADNKTGSKPAPKKPARKKPATVNYTDKNTGVTFEYPRRYAIETGSAANDVLMSSPVPMNFVAPGGVALAAVELPETGYANTDFDMAFFNVSVHKNLTPEQCNEFSVPATKMDAAANATQVNVAQSSAPSPIASQTTPEVKPEVKEEVKQEAKQEAKPEAKPEAQVASMEKPEASSQTCHPEDSTQCGPKDPTAAAANNAAEKATTAASSATTAADAQGSKLLVGDLELRATEAVSGEGTRQSDSKYFHVYQNGSCYEFALNVTTVASNDGAGLIKHVDRDKVFTRLAQILDTVKISPVPPEPTTAEAPVTPTAPASPAQ